MAYRDMSVPYTEEELQGLRGLFRSMPTYQDGHIRTSDFAAFTKGMQYERTPEQIASYKVYWDQNSGGKVSEEVIIGFAKAIHKTSLLAREFAITADVDKNGFISADEFVRILEVLSAQEPSLCGKTYEGFLKEADTNKDGKVDIDECTKWIEKCAD